MSARSASISVTALLLICACLQFASIAHSEPNAVAEFYKGKTITILIGFPTGSSYDIYARLAASNLGRFIPGQPSIMVQSRPGGSGVGAVVYFSANAPKDGTMLGIFPETIAISELTEPRLGKWDERNFTYIGSFANSNGVFLVRKGAPAATVEQMRVTPVHVGCNGRTGASYIDPAILKAYAGMKFEIHCGYPASSEIAIALERGEIDVTAGAWAPWRSRSLLLEGKVRPVIQAGIKRHTELSDIPLMQELIADSKKAEVAEFLSAGSAIGRALLAPRAVPPDRIAGCALPSNPWSRMTSSEPKRSSRDWSSILSSARSSIKSRRGYCRLRKKLFSSLPISLNRLIYSLSEPEVAELTRFRNLIGIDAVVLPPSLC